MKTISLSQVGASLVVFFVTWVTGWGQGSLQPPGVPGPTMKTLQQVEPRTPITNTPPITISSSGSYYLTTNIIVSTGDGISISGDNVTLDLNGFTVISTEATPSGTGILLGSGVQNIRIFNGHIRGSVENVGGGGDQYTGPGFLNGISYTGDTPLNVRVSDMTVSGCDLNGIHLGTDFSSTAANLCNVRTVGGDGINAGSVNDCVAYFCGGNGIVCVTVANSSGRSTGSARGIYTQTAVNCYGDSPGGNGLEAVTAASACIGSSTTGTGLKAGTAQNCHGGSAFGTGLIAEQVINCRGTSNGGGAGISGVNVLNSEGKSSSFIGILCSTAQNSRGFCSSGGARA